MDKLSADKCKDTEEIGGPKCWKKIYCLLDLYTPRPDTKTITHRFSVPVDVGEHFKGGKKVEEPKDADVEKGVHLESSSTPIPVPSKELSKFFFFFFFKLCSS